MEQAICTLLSQESLTPLIRRAVLRAPTASLTRPGQFVNIRLEGHFLRRPISVCDWDAETITIVYKIVGAGTRDLAALPPDAKLDLLLGLGNGFDTSKSGDAPLLIGGGVGTPPLYGLCRRLREEGKEVTAILGFNTAAECILAADFEALGARVLLATADGSAGVRGFVTDAMATLPPQSTSYFYTCGPEPMLKAVDRVAETDGQFSFEERMGCGFGACVGCTCETKYGPKRICRDGPVLEREEIVW